MTESRCGWRGPRATIFFALTGFAILTALGTWQVERRAWKADLIATMDARLAMAPQPIEELLARNEPVDFHPVRAIGIFRHDRELYLAARSYQGQLGYHVVTPLVLGVSQTTVLVDRGWVPVDHQEPSTRTMGQLPGEVSIVGIARRPAKPGAFTPDNRPDQNLWYWADLPAMGAQVGAPQVASILIEAGPAENPGGLPIGGQTRVNLPNDHLQYAITWYSLALALAVIYFVSHRRNTGGDNPTQR